MKASLPQNPTEQLRGLAWRRICTSNSGAREASLCFVLHDARRTPLAQFISAPAEQILKDIRQVQELTGHRSPYVTGVGLPRTANLDAGGKAARREGMFRRGIPPMCRDYATRYVEHTSGTSIGVCVRGWNDLT